MLRALLLVFLLFAASNAAAEANCAPRLWPAKAPFSTLSAPLRADLIRAAQRLKTQPPIPVVELKSAGVVDVKDPQLVESRAALADANRAAILALAYRVNGEKSDLAAGRDTLMAWANVYRPVGHPIDESKLDQMIWAYDLLRCDLPSAERAVIERWIGALLDKKDTWRFGPSSVRNNHHTHQLKLQILGAAALGDRERLARYTTQARDHAVINIDVRDGASRDFLERDALHYHAFNLEAWDEIELVTRCCTAPVVASAEFLWRKLATGDVERQFTSSQVDIDRRRAQAGHAYLAAHYDSARATRAALAFYTGRCAPAEPVVRNLLDKGMQESRYLFFAARRALWNISFGC